MSTKERCGHPVKDSKAGVMSTCGRPKGHKSGKNGYAAHTSVAAMQHTIKSAAEANARAYAAESICAFKGCDGVAPKGMLVCRECDRVYKAKPEVKARNAARYAARYATPEDKARRAAYYTAPEVKARYVAWYAARYATPEGRARYADWRAAYDATPEGREVRRKAVRDRRQRLANANYEDLTNPQIFERDNGRCYICGDTAVEVEHVIAVAAFADYVISKDLADDYMSGLRAVCIPCNRGLGGKFDKDPAAYALERWQAGKPLVQAETVRCADVCPLFALAA